MKLLTRKKIAGIVSLIVGVVMVATSVLPGASQAPVDKVTQTAQTDTLKVNFFDFEQDKVVYSTAPSLLLFRRNSLKEVDKFGTQNSWREFMRTAGLASLVDGKLTLKDGLSVSEQNGGADFFSTENLASEGHGGYKGTVELTLEKMNDAFGFDSKTQVMLFEGRSAYFDECKTASVASATDSEFWPYGKDNAFFGISFEKTFYFPGQGVQIESDEEDAEAKDIIFSFSGDDDVWLFVDGKIALDLGGIHGAYSGIINFTKDTVTYSYASHKNGSKNSGNIEYTTTPDYPEYVYENGVDAEGNPLEYLSLTDVLGETLEGGKNHTITFFYLERGDFESNCSFSYNVPDAVFEVVHVFEESITDGVRTYKSIVDFADADKYFCSQYGSECLKRLSEEDGDLRGEISCIDEAAAAYTTQYEHGVLLGKNETVKYNNGTEVVDIKSAEVVSNLEDSVIYILHDVFVPTSTPTPIPSDTPTPIPSDTPTPIPSDTPTPVPSDTPTPTPEVTNTPTPTPEIIVTPTPPLDPPATPTPTPGVTSTPTPTPEVTTTPTPTPEVTTTPTPTPEVIVTPTPPFTPPKTGDTNINVMSFAGLGCILFGLVVLLTGEKKKEYEEAI